MSFGGIGSMKRDVRIFAENNRLCILALLHEEED